MYFHSKKRRRHLHALPAAIALALVALAWFAHDHSARSLTDATAVESCDKCSMV